MIQLLAAKYSKDIAYIFFLLLMGTLTPARSHAAYRKNGFTANSTLFTGKKGGRPLYCSSGMAAGKTPVKPGKKEKVVKIQTGVIAAKKDIGGPSQPEMSRFKSVSSDNLVNLFTGDFSYNIPLLDVGGYPINIFYDGGITMEQEASWVGLGWNINPGSVTRNMRGVPDDFNGEDLLKQKQLIKPNKTWGVSLDLDFELLGIKVLNVSVGGSIGVSFNNYLGPALDIGTKGNVGVKVAGKTNPEKMSLSVGAGLGASVNSRSGLTLSPNVSLTAGNFKNEKDLTAGIRLGTSWNSKSGIKQLQISEQMGYSYEKEKCVREKEKLVRFSRTPTLFGSTISFSKPSYIPSIRIPLNNEATAGRFQLGGAIYGIYASAEVEVYKQTSEVAMPDQSKPLVGYLYYQQGVNNPDMVMDFTRLNDNEVTPNTPIISAPQYTYDVFTIQGEGTGGSIRAYRNDLGYVRDNTTTSRDKNQSAGIDIGIPGHFGANYNIIQTPTVIGEWVYGNKLRQGLTFGNARQSFENVYFKNPGETTVLNTNQFTKIGGTDLVRYIMGGSAAMPTIEPQLERFSKMNEGVGVVNLPRNDTVPRAKRSQVTTFLTAYDAAIIGLDRDIKSYNSSTFLNSSNILQYTAFQRVTPERKKHHLSQITVAEGDGKRYVYGLPVYNIFQKDYSFSVDSAEKDNGTVGFTPDEPGTLKSASTKDGYIQVTETPAYAHSFLISGILSPDYIDLTYDGITEDDLGQAVKFNYTFTGNHAWRTPLTSDRIAHFNAGNRTDAKDDKGIVSYGLRETWYQHSVESKTMIAFFTLEDRNDGNGAFGELSGINTADNTLKRLKKIDLYSKADLKKNGITGARPVKTVWFGYSYSLCAGTPDNTNGGKLTLDSIWFTFNGQKSVRKNKYVFAYTNAGAGNPAYAFNAADRWGNYKPDSRNPSGLKNKDYPYSVQDKAAADQDAAAWGLKKILLPSGARIEVNYESDDYAFVQDRRACNMLPVTGLGTDTINSTNNLYILSAVAGNVIATFECDHVFIQVPEPCTTKEQVFQKYLQGHDQLAFKIAVNMPNGIEYIPVYGTIGDYGVRDSARIWVRLNKVDGLSPLSLAALDYLRERLPAQAYPGYDVSDNGGLKQVGEMFLGLLDGLKGAFRDPVKYLRSQGKAQTMVPAYSFVRLNDADGFKYGGGHRVKSVILKDTMAGQPSIYGQQYDYTTTETFNGATRTISSGVASYEPGIGSEENPFQSIVQVSNTLPLGPTAYGAIEMPVLDAFFPASLVGYSKVTVRSLKNNYSDTTKRSRSGVGKQVTEFYTAKDYPVYYQHTSFDPGSNKEEHKASLTAFFSKYAFDSRALSQGFLVATNDMHGKMRSQSSYAEHDTGTRINYVQNFYRNTGSTGLDEKFDFMYASQGGTVSAGNMGIDIELMTDTREFSVKSTSFEIQGQLDMFPVILPFWLPFIWPVSGESENTYRAVTTTKVINYHGILDSVVVIDKGSTVSTKNLVYDAETGQVIVNRTNNEFDKPIYNVTYPAWWAYSGMGPAYKNIDAVYTGINFYEGKIINAGFDMSIFESGDELYVNDPGKDTAGCVIPAIATRIWAFDKNKNNTSLTVPVKDLVFIDPNGYLVSKNKVSFRIVRSGKRNMLDAQVSAITMMSDPIAANPRKLTINSSSKVINASVVEYRDRWQTDNDLIARFKTVYSTSTCIEREEVDCNGYLDKKINPYAKGLLGNFRPLRSREFYGNRTETDPAVATNLPLNGFINNFTPFWGFDLANNLVPDNTITQWEWTSHTSRYNSKGMELESYNALNIYTAVQYGYNKTVPVAIANNARYHEMAYEGFEDNVYAEALNNIIVNSCAQKHINLAGVANTRIVNSNDSGFAAHTGKYMLGIDPGKTASKTFTVGSHPVETYALPFTKDTVQRLDMAGGNIDVFIADPPFEGNPSDPDAYVENTTTFSNGGMRTSLWPLNTLSIPGDGSEGPDWRSFFHRVRFAGYYYIDVPQQGTYQFTASAVGNSLEPTENTYSITVEVIDNKGNTINTTSFSYVYGDVNQTFYVTLCKGIHLIRATFLNEYYRQTPFPESNVVTSYIFSLTTNASVVNYKKLSKSNSCIYTKPIAVTDTMLNPVFSVPVNKKMVFSAWVRENCGNAAGGVPCTDTTYTKNQVQLTFNQGTANNVTLKPTGPIIEGWQRYEGYFTAPAGATQMTMNLVNSSSSNIYFDDIRIHPFNANMNSYVYDPVNLRLVAELDANNYATFYEYDEEGGLIRTKAETREGVKTINETRSFQQRSKRAL
jgi:hypothetical protein